MDLFQDFLPTVKVESAAYTRVEARSPWGLEFIPYLHTKFGIVTQGTCYIDLKGNQAPVKLEAGSCWLLTRGDAFRLRENLNSPIIDFEKALDQLEGRLLKCGGNGEQTTIVGGRFIFVNDQPAPILDLLPPLIHFKVNPAELKALEATIELLGNESHQPSLGSSMMIDHLADIFFIQSLRAYWLSEPQQSVGWLGGAADQKLSKALRLIHHQPQQAWTLAALAQNAGMSRAIFAARFKEKIGLAPISYLTRFRLSKAQQLLRQPNLSIAQIAEEVGYTSEAAFNKAFKRELGQPPGLFRRQEK